MIQLHPHTEVEHDCPYCQQRLACTGWLIPGMRNLAQLNCARCGREFYGDLRSGQALYTPMLLEKATGVVHDAYGVDWFADWLSDSYADRVEAPISFEVQELRKVNKPVVFLNCIDTLYGHSLLKLLNAERLFKRHPDLDLIVMVPALLAWMVPDGAAQIWKVDLSLPRGREWNDWVDREIHTRLAAFERVFLSFAYSHPRSDEYEITRFTQVLPFPLEEWAARLQRPTVTFIWRDDRSWQSSTPTAPSGRRMFKNRRPWASIPDEQHEQVLKLAETLRNDWPTLDFAVAGLGKDTSRKFPEWITDLRLSSVDDNGERRLCQRYAASHVVVGVHGSSMLLPSGHAGSVVEFIDSDRWGNFTQDILFREGDNCREMFFRYRFIPRSMSPSLVAKLVNQLLSGREIFRELMNTKRGLTSAD